MKKIEAINALISHECDSIRHGASVFVMNNDDIVNKRSKKPLDNKKMLEDDWETVTEPKWYDELENKNILCWINEKDVSIIYKMDDNGEFINGFGEVFGKTHNVVPVTPEEAKEVLFGTLVTKRKSPTKQTVPTKDIEPEETEKVNTAEAGEEKGNEDTSPTESTEPIAKPKVVATEGVPILVAENKDYFIGLGLPDELWTKFWVTNGLTSVTVGEIMEKGDEFVVDMIGKLVNSEVPQEEIPF